MSAKHFGRIFSEEWQDIILGKKSLRDHLEHIFQETIFQQDVCSPAEYIDYWLNGDQILNAEMFNLALDCTALNIKCCLGTNQDVVRTAHLRTSLRKHFKKVFSSCEIGWIKLEKEFYHIQADLGIDPGQIILIDDDKANVEAAEAFGWKTFHYGNNCWTKNTELIKFLFQNSCSFSAV